MIFCFTLVLVQQHQSQQRAGSYAASSQTPVPATTPSELPILSAPSLPALTPITPGSATSGLSTATPQANTSVDTSLQSADTSDQQTTIQQPVINQLKTALNAVLNGKSRNAGASHIKQPTSSRH
jgi:hypothetical protein